MTKSDTYDLVVLGGGAAAFAAITEADRRGLSTALVNSGLPLGGTCVNVGCVPSKHLLEVGKTAFEPPRTPFKAISYDDGQPATNWHEAIAEKDDLVAGLQHENYASVADHFGTKILEGYGAFSDSRTIEILDGQDAGRSVTGKKILIATGSSPAIPDFPGLTDVPYETSESILERTDLPEHVIMIGGGYVGLEWSQILHHFGASVTILQRSDRVLSAMEPQLGEEIERTFTDEGIEVITGAQIQAIDGSDRTIENDEDVVVAADVGGSNQTFAGSDLFLATGVTPNTDEIGLESAKIATENSGAIQVNKRFQTANPDVYAAGDCIGEPMLETTAAKEGNHAVKNAVGDEGVTIDYQSVPAVVYTSPEVASVGITEAEYVEEFGTCTCRTVRMDDVPKAKAVRDSRGFVQVVKHHETDEIVGVHMVGARAADMISEATLAVKFGLTVDDIIDTVHPFPTFSEAFKHACQAFRRDVSKMSCCVE
ncbi:mercuric reductase [Halalkaliarchaeum desulfuricum]|uniref:Mercuric reductase n=1 Tax=Halalkaliarchaeum desulfuricum TaxID=2055893 RepID=A0A343THX5_9EURY|nr:mercury(II) reductase [Halalkaliarchaeum desulfuricum]AUX08697.1 mercuric reductase [Halalkaliarchaeum desulfuricum]